jgi:methyl-accepting chemotaxis protein
MEKGANDITYQLSALAKITTSANVLAAIKSRIEQAVREMKSACEEARLEAHDLDQKINTAISGQPTAVLIPTP